MRILSLQAENFKRLRAISIQPDGSLVTIKGNNGQGKTSALDAIAAALGGEKLCPSAPIRRGEETAEVQLDLGDIIVSRKWTAAGSSLTVKSREGARYPSPQSVLDKLVGKLSFDPLAFTRAKPAEQVETLRKLVGLDFSLLDRQRKELYEQRTIVNRDATVLKGSLARMPEVEAPAAPVSVVELLAEQEARLKQAQAVEAAVQAVQAAGTRRDAIARELDRARQEVADLEARLKKARELASALEDDHANALQEREEAAIKAASMPRPDLEGIRKQLADAEGVNAKVRAARARAAEAAKLAAKESEAQGLTEKIDALDAQKATALNGARFPVEGLSFTDSEVTLNGLPLDQASGAERLRVSLAVGIALNPKLKVLLIRDGSLLDEQSLRLVAEMAERADAQVWIEQVGKSGAHGVVIEDGLVDGLPPKPLTTNGASAEVIY